MASCNMCRNGKTALGRDCPNGCRSAPLQEVVDRLQAMSEVAEVGDQVALRDAIGLIMSRATPGEYRSR
jgi:hypothetical protein